MIRFIVNFLRDKTIGIMNVVVKRDYIHNHLHNASESTLEGFYERLRKEEVLKS